MEEEKQDRVFLPVFDGSNFSAWKFRMLVLLEEHELVECVQRYAADVDELKDDPADTQEQKNRKANQREKRAKKDRRCKSLLVGRIHDSQLEYVRDKQHPKDVWDALHRVFERHSVASRMHLKRQMLTLRYETGSLQQHFLRFDSLVREYRATGSALDELDVVCHLLLTLGSSYSAVVTALETMPEDVLTLEFVKCRLLDEETKRKGTKLSTVKNEQAAFSGSKQITKRGKMKCFGCKQEGHKLADCPVKKNEDAKKKEDSKKKDVNKSKAHVAEQSEVCFAGFSRGNARSGASNRVDWYIDSGCSDHLVNDKSLFVELRELEHPVEIAIAKDGETIEAKQAGTVKVTSVVNGKEIKCSVKNVLYVPELRCNLFSVIRCDEAGMKVVFESESVQIYRDSEMVATGSRVGKLYRLDLFVDSRNASDSLLSFGRVPANLELWHRRFGHLNARSLEKLISEDMCVGLKLNGRQKNDTVIVCEPCVEAKQTRNPFQVRKEPRSSRILELIHSDVCGPVKPIGVGGMRYFVTFVDDWSHFVMVFLMKSKDEVYDCFQQYAALVSAKFGRKISRFRCDNGGEYKNRPFVKFCERSGIQIEWTVAHTPEQNGVSERMNRSLVERARAMLQDSGVNKCFWGCAVQTAAYLLNRSPSSAIDPEMTPYQLWEGSKPDVHKLRVFGCTVFVHIPKERRGKLDAKSWKGLFLGYAHNGYRVWHSTKRQILHVRDVDFVETVHGENTPGCSYERASDIFSVAADDEKSESDVSEIGEQDSGSEAEPDASESDEQDSGSEADSVSDYESFVEEDRSGGDSEPGSSHGSENDSVEPCGTGRPMRDRKPPAWQADYDMEYATCALNATEYVEDLPRTLAEAKARKDWPKWEAAVNEEMAALKKNKTWRLTELPGDRKAITSKWVFKVKPGMNGQPERYKARLVARGFSQKFGFDYSETYSPVAKLDTLRSVLAIACRDKMVVHQMDVCTAFLNGSLTEEIFMIQPEGFVEGNNLVCRLEKSLYGLKQASRAWNSRFHSFVVDRLGFQQSANDRCLYTRGSGATRVILVLYVDDVVIAGASLKAVQLVKNCLSKEFEMKDIGEIKCFLGMQVDYDLAGGVMKITQRNYLENVLKRFKMEDCKPCSTPIENRLKLSKGDDQNRTTQPFRELVGCLSYASLTTRPDLAASVNFYSQFQSCPSDEHWAHLKRILRYVKGSLDFGLVFRADKAAPLLEVFSDADWANDSSDRRSVSGGVFKVFGCTVSWLTRKQQTVALSSTEAELSALCTVTCHEMWLNRLLYDLGYSSKEPICVYEDNQSAMRIAEESKDFGRVKHIDVKFHFLRDLIRDGCIVLKYLPSADQPADMMTKGLPVAAFRRHRTGIGLVDCSG